MLALKHSTVASAIEEMTRLALRDPVHVGINYKTLDAGVSTTDPAQRFAIYSKLLQRPAIDVPYVPLMVTDDVIALSRKFIVPGYNPYSMDNALCSEREAGSVDRMLA